MRLRAPLILPLLLAALFVAAPVADASDSRQTASLVFTNEKAGKPSGLALDIDYVNPDEASAKPPAVREVVIKLARGAAYDTSVPDLCEASDAELMALGAAACSEGSKVGRGVVTVDTGLPGPARIVTADVDFLNNTGEQIFVNTVRGTSVRTVLRSEVSGRRNAVMAPFLPGTPPDGGAIDTVKVRNARIVRERDGVRRAYISTPPRCPDRGFWVNGISFTYYDGITQTVRSRSRCEA
jgi:hypothetical protein